ncbi:uncharacterized protein LOC111040146 [Myzus persicae]|uniref:uncharacterized protein LOC111040146 n=1 Tax=Myzus persicae TaxID=13164 RepID=UPI000B936260|nr:uncharacterized protein LOC111040146 [Myzus persicae]
MSSSSSSRTSQSDGQQVAIDAENSVNYNRLYGSREESCSTNLIRNNAAYKIILDRGIMDGQYMRLSIPQALRVVDTSNTVEVVAMMNIINAAIIADAALISSEIAMNAANLAVQLSGTPAEEVIIDGERMIALEMLVEIALAAVESTRDFVNMARLMPRSNSLGGDG